MKIASRDWILIAAIVAVLAFLFTGKSRSKAGGVPNNEKHKPFYEAMIKGQDRKDIEKGCVTCHGIQGIQLSKGHPPKEQCLICHKLAG
jgi:hypothetical protein